MDFDKAFKMFLDRREYDQAENALFCMVRISFLAGWKAAGGNLPLPQKGVKLKHQKILGLVSEISTDIK